MKDDEAISSKGSDSKAESKRGAIADALDNKREGGTMRSSVRPATIWRAVAGKARARWDGANK